MGACQLFKSANGRSILHLLAFMGMVTSLATPILHRYDTQFSTSVDFLFFGQHQWSYSVMPIAPRKKCWGSIILTTAGVAALAFTPILSATKWYKVSLAILIFTVLALVFSVLNMQIGVHFYDISPGVYFGGEMDWGVGNSIHMAACGVMLIPIVAIIARMCKAKRDNDNAGDLVNGNSGDSSAKEGKENTPFLVASAPNSTPPVSGSGGFCVYSFSVLVVPELIALVLAVAGAGAPQAQAPAKDALGYLATWHYSIVSSDYDLAALRDFLVCDEFYKRLLAACVCAVAAATFSFFSLGASLLSVTPTLVESQPSTLLSKRGSLAAAIFSTMAFLVGGASMAVATSLVIPINCGDVWKNQGQLTVNGGLIAMYAGVLFSFITAMMGFLPCCSRNGDDGEDSATVVN